MGRETYVLRDGVLVLKRLAVARAAPAPMIRPDGMDAVRCMADGRRYDSRSAYQAAVRRAGCEIVGDDAGGFGRAPDCAPGDIAPDIANDIKRTLAELSRGS
jgi:hypothetical protein